MVSCARTRIAALVVGLALSFSVATAWAHWCNCLWVSSYNLVVRPVKDSVSDVPLCDSTVNLDVYVQNNMGYPLYDFKFTATCPEGYKCIGMSGMSPTVSTGAYSSLKAPAKPYLMPGEKILRSVGVCRTSGSWPATVRVDQLDFGIDFGYDDPDIDGARQRNAYPRQDKADVVIRNNDGTLSKLPEDPSTFTNWGDGQALHLGNAAKADFGDEARALNDLLFEFCAGRSTWNSSSKSTYCAKDTTTTKCPTSASSSEPSDGDVQHLWAAQELVARGSRLSDVQREALRERLKCAFEYDSHPLVKSYVLFALGYLGDEATKTTAFAFLSSIVDGTYSPPSGAITPTVSDKAIAKAALVLMHKDRTGEKATVQTNATSATDEYVKGASAGALGIVDGSAADSYVKTVLLGVDANGKAVDRTNADYGYGARWVYPGHAKFPFFASHVLALVAWSRRGYQTAAGDTGYPSFYVAATPTDNVPPAAPASITCEALNIPAGTLSVSWSAVTQDKNGGPETGVSYLVDWDNVSHASCTAPGTNCNYGHSDPVAGLLSKDYASSDGKKTYYFRARAVDGAGNRSVYTTTEATCVPRYPPVAALTCTPASATVPPAIDVTCDASGSTDPNNGTSTSDITSYAFKLDTNAPESGTAKSKTYHFDTAVSHAVQVTVTDSTGLTSTKVVTITLDSPTNKAPIAVATATPTSVALGTAIQFDGTGSSDPDDANKAHLTYAWDFGEPSSSQNTSTLSTPTHTYAASGHYTVTLRVTDLGGASGVKVIYVDVTDNHAPDVTRAAVTVLATPPLTVGFNGSLVTDPDGDHVVLTWNFGDSTPTQQGTTVTHTYAKAGTYTATLSAQDDGLPHVGPATRQFQVVVSDQPAANRPPNCSTAVVRLKEGTSSFDAGALTGPAPLKLVLDASTCTDPDGNNLAFEWHIPPAAGATDETVFTTAVAEYTLSDARLTTITLTVRDDGSPAQQVSMSFPVQATGSPQSPDTAVEALMCGCTTSSVGPSALGLFLAGLALMRRRR